jgi:hypothetical protein
MFEYMTPRCKSEIRKSVLVERTGAGGGGFRARNKSLLQANGRRVRENE